MWPPAEGNRGWGVGNGPEDTPPLAIPHPYSLLPIPFPQCGLPQRRSGGLVEEADHGRDMLAAEVVGQDQTPGTDVGVVEGLAQHVDRSDAHVEPLEPRAPVRQRLLAEDAAEEL